MKKIFELILAIIFLTGCAAKTRISNNAKVSTKTESIQDHRNEKTTQIADKSTTVTIKDIDTNIITIGKSLTGYINPDQTTAHFENDDLSLDLENNKITGITKVITASKPKKTNIRIHKKTIIHNDINTNQTIKSSLKTKVEAKTDSITSHVVNHIEPVVSFKSFKSVLVWIFIIAVLLIALIYFFKKFSVISLITGWIKQLI